MTAATDGAQAADPENTVYIRLSTGGTVTMELLPEIAPQHVERIKTLAREGFYDGVAFHRVIDGFMAQTGDPTGTGMGGSDLPDLPAEFTETEYKRGTVGMARSQSPDSANSQFFFCFTDTGCSFLKGQYTVFAQVTDGMAEIDKVAKGEPPANPDKMEKVTIAADVQAEDKGVVDTAKDAANDAVDAIEDAAEATGDAVEDLLHTDEKAAQ